MPTYSEVLALQSELCRFVQRKFPALLEAEDVAAAAIATAWKKGRIGDGSIDSSARRSAYRAAKNHGRNAARRAGRWSYAELDEIVTGGDLGLFGAIAARDTLERVSGKFTGREKVAFNRLLRGEALSGGDHVAVFRARMRLQSEWLQFVK